MNFDKLLEILSQSQKDILICFIIQLPLCYTFMYFYSDFFVRQELLNKVIFAITFDISLSAISIFYTLLSNAILHKYDIKNLIYLFTGINIFIFLSFSSAEYTMNQ